MRAIHRMQRWRTTRSSPGTSCMKARLVGLFHRSPRKLRENSGDEGKEFVRRGTKARSLHFRLEDLWENRFHDELMWCLVVFQHDLNDQCLPHGKEKLLLQDPLSQKGKLFTSTSTRNHCRKRILRCKWTSVALVIVSSESIEPNDNDVEVNAVAYAFAKIFQPETCWNVTNNL